MEEKDPQEFFDTGPFEKIISGALSLALKSHGPITHENKPSATKRIAGSIRGYLQDFNTRHLQAHLLEKERARLKKKKEELDRILPRLQRSRDDLLEKCREAGLI